MKVLCAAEHVCQGCPLESADVEKREATEASVDNLFAQFAWKSLAQLSIREAKGWAQTMQQEVTIEHLGDTRVTKEVLEVIGRIADERCTNFELSNHIK